MPRASVLESSAQIALGPEGSLRLAVVADTHSAPHPKTHEQLRKIAPDAILHAGDIGDLTVLDSLREIAPLFAVRGNIDERAADLPDVLLVDVMASLEDAEPALRILLMHIAVDGPRLRADAARLAKARDAALVVCGHSHVPLIARDSRERSLSIFNPGSVGPRRFRLPIVFGTIDISRAGVKMQHIDVQTGQPWAPRAL